ncbi:uncharacterized protein LOC124183917 [Neodiprion fabricii]|uniref:uncharacterized protein LOC124183917 n=1 Tax=Neodiprion fabricii TaxID=2872261 RepID=UPI001ED9810E|nr:uncharacterized protein LOC124183917 [Neodiprion fabricii]
MSDSGETLKYKWTPDSTTLLVSVWTDKQVQKQLEYATKPQLIWDSVARYMQKKGYNVSGKQCRSRMKQVLVCYREAKKTGTRAGVEQYYESIDKVLKDKRLLQSNINGVDTVDVGVNIKSPPKDVKTNKNLQMRYQYRDPVETLLRTEALSPMWELAHDEEYPDSPESNETVLAQPYRTFSPVRDAATNTIQHLAPNMKKSLRQNAVPVKEIPIQQTFRQASVPNNCYSEIPFQNTVQNVQNHIIQENMQQNQALLQQNLLQAAHNHLMQQNMLQNNPALQQNLLHNTNQILQSQMPPNSVRISTEVQPNIILNQNRIPQNIQRTQNQFQQSSAAMNKQAMPQEPRKASFRQNLAATYKQYQDAIPTQNFNHNVNQTAGQLSPNIFGDIGPNLNDAFCETPKHEKPQNLNETFNQALPMYNPLFLPSLDATSLTTNATYNDDTLSIEFLQESPTPSEKGLSKSKDSAVNTESAPDAPFRKKKAQKLEQLMMSALSSQNEVVNKILAAQSDMVTRFLDIDRDRQNRLENRLDHLLNVVHASVLNQSPEKEAEIPPPLPEPKISRLAPPPKPGVVPPKLDLVPPKPCRVPCTLPNSKIELVNQNPLSTRPGVVTPITSPSGKPGTIWSKLGPVSQSPFVRAQMQLGFYPITNTEVRTQSSAERRIAKQGGLFMDTKTLISETITFLDAERRVDEKVENARRQIETEQDTTSGKKLSNQIENYAGSILSAAFIETEKQVEEMIENATLACSATVNNLNVDHKDRAEILVTGQGEGYEYLRQLNSKRQYENDPIKSSTPAKTVLQSRVNDGNPRNAYTTRREQERRVNFDDNQQDNTKQTIQQLAQLVMNSARWRNAANQHQQDKNDVPSAGFQNIATNVGPRFNKNQTCTNMNAQGAGNTLNAYLQSRSGTINRDSKPLIPNKDRYSYGGQPAHVRQAMDNNVRLSYNGPVMTTRPQMGFTTDLLASDDSDNIPMNQYSDQVGFVVNPLLNYKQPKRFFTDVDKDQFVYEQQQQQQQQQLRHAYNKNFTDNRRTTQSGPPYMTSNGHMVMAQTENMIRQYIHSRKGKDDKDTDSDNDEVFLDTTASMPPSSSRRSSLTSMGTAISGISSKSGKADGANCIVS